MKKYSKIMAVKKVALPLILSPLCGVVSVHAERPHQEQIKYESCIETKFSWIFEDYSPFTSNSMKERNKSIDLFVQELSVLDLNRLTQKDHQDLLTKAKHIKIPTYVAESIICSERIRRNYPEQENKEFLCGQSCGFTVK